METRARRFPLASWLALVVGLTFAIPAASQTPIFQYSTFLGGTGQDVGYDIAAGPNGTAFIFGTTRSHDFLKLTGPVQGPLEGDDGNLLFVVALDAGGRLLYSTLLQNSPVSYRLVPAGIAAAPDGSAYLAYTVVGDEDWFFAYAVRLSPSGEIVYHQVLPGNTFARGIAADGQGNAYMVGSAEQGGFYYPGFQFHGRAAFVVKLAPQGRGQLRTYDGSGDDQATAVGVDPAGNLFVTGFTTSPDFFSQFGILVKGVYGGGGDAFLLELDAGDGDAASLIYLGGSGEDRATDLAVDQEGNVFVTGITSSPDFPLIGPPQPTPPSSPAFFLSRLSAAGDPISSTFVGPASRTDSGAAIAFGGGRDLFWMGGIFNLPPWDPEPFFCEGTALLRFDRDGLDLRQSACYFTAWASGFDADPHGYLYFTGLAWEDFSSRPGALQRFFGGRIDAFATRLRFNQPPDCTGATASPDMIWPPNGKLIPVSIRGVIDPDGDPVTPKITGIRQDEPLSSRNGFDATGLGTPNAMIRADRIGEGDGRVYHLSFEVRDDKDAACTGTVEICVPHDQRPGAICRDGGPLFDSTAN